MIKLYKNKSVLKGTFFLIPSLFFAISFSGQSLFNQDSLMNTKMAVPKAIRTGDDVYNAIKVGVIIPQGLFGQPLSNPGGNNYPKLALPFKGLAGIGATYGYNFQYEGFSAFGKPHSSKKVTAHFGLQYGIDFGYVPLNWNNVNWNNYDMSVGTSPFMYLGVKIGPSFFINPTKDLGIGIFGTIDPYFVVPGGEYATYNNTDALGDKTVSAYYIQDTNVAHFSLDASAGINLYYKAFIIGVEYNWIHTKYDGSIKENIAQTNSNGVSTTPPSTYIAFGSVIQTNIIKLTLGIRLGYGCKHRYDVASDE